MLLGKAKLATIAVLIFKALMDSNISHDQFVLVNDILREYSEMKEEIKNLQNAVEYSRYKQWKAIVSCKKNTANENSSVRKTKQNVVRKIQGSFKIKKSSSIQQF